MQPTSNTEHPKKEMPSSEYWYLITAKENAFVNDEAGVGDAVKVPYRLGTGKVGAIKVSWMER